MSLRESPSRPSLGVTGAMDVSGDLQHRALGAGDVGVREMRRVQKPRTFELGGEEGDPRWLRERLGKPEVCTTEPTRRKFP